MVQKPVEWFLSIDRINHHHEILHHKLFSEGSDRFVFQSILDVLNVTFNCDDNETRHIPSSGPLVVIANHPFGGIEGVILADIVTRIRPDVRIMGNYLLKKVIGLRDWIIAVNPFDSRQIQDNLHGLKQALSWVKNGGALVVFPAGEVASWRLKDRQVLDSKWSPHIAALIRMTKATALPVFFPGQNSALFSIAGIFSAHFRTMLLPRELVNKTNRNFEVHIGSPIPWSHLRRHSRDTAIIDYLRVNTEILQFRSNLRSSRFPRIGKAHDRAGNVEPLIKSIPGYILQAEVDHLPDSQCLIQQGNLCVYFADSSQIPNLLKEIGRLRESAFREIHEGTGRSVDLDEFDIHYQHLFLWNHHTNELVGAYRLGLVDIILNEFGIQGLYTNTLFQYKPKMIDYLTHAIEFGRSFIRSEYQKKFNSLFLIWRGIGEFIRRNSHYNILFGPVSISRDYQPISKNLMINFLMKNQMDDRLSPYVKPRRPYRFSQNTFLRTDAVESAFRNIEDISLAISGIEKDGKGVPILLKHYLKLNGKILCFSIDEKFSDVVDGLLMVDLRKTDIRLLQRFIKT